MEKHKKTPSGAGLELDKIEIPGRSSPNTVNKSTTDTDQNATRSSETGSNSKKNFWLVVTAVATTLAILAVLAIYLKRQDLKITSIAFNNTSISDSYLRVGPITATINSDEIIRLSLDIQCKNDNVKEKLGEKDSRIRDKIVSILSAPDTVSLLKKHQYDAVRTKIKESLEKTYGESIGEIYFADLLTY